MHCTIHHYPMGVGEGRLYSSSISHHTWQEQAILGSHAQLWGMMTSYVSSVIIGHYRKLVKLLSIKGKGQPCGFIL